MEHRIGFQCNCLQRLGHPSLPVVLRRQPFRDLSRAACCLPVRCNRTLTSSANCPNIPSAGRFSRECERISGAKDMGNGRVQ